MSALAEETDPSRSTVTRPAPDIPSDDLDGDEEVASHDQHRIDISQPKSRVREIRRPYPVQSKCADRLAKVIPRKQVPSGPGEKEVVRLHDARRVLSVSR